VAFFFLGERAIDLVKAWKKDRMRRRAVEEWRGLPEKVISHERVRSVSESVPKFLKGLGLKERFEEEEMMRSWRELVGDFIADNSQPVKVRGKVLYVQVLQPTLHYDLDRTLKGKLLKRIQDRYGAHKVREVRLMLG